MSKVSDSLWEVFSEGKILVYLWLTDEIAEAIKKMNPHLTIQRFSP